MVLKIKINDNDEFKTYSIGEVAICNESSQPFITVTFDSYFEIVETI